MQSYYLWLPYTFWVEAYGSDGDIVTSDTHITISWKTLRGRLATPDAAAFEILPISSIYDVSIIPATSTRNGCLQLHLIGNPSSISREHNWISNLHAGKITHGVMFNLSAQFQFKALADHIQRQIYFLSKNRTNQDFGTNSASS